MRARAREDREARKAADFFSSASSFSLPPGSFISAETPRGYYIDLRAKAQQATWPPAWLPDRSEQVFVEIVQWGLGAYERFVAGEGPKWLQAAIGCAEYLLRIQESAGPCAGAWFYRHPCPHTYRLDPPWISSMAQGEGASLLVRLGLATGDARYFDAALRATEVMHLPVELGGSEGRLGGRPFPQEYPTTPPAHVLNGGIFALWGYWDVAAGCGSASASAAFEEGLECLASNINRWDTGYWSRYDLYPHPVANIASSFYHALHIAQLEAMLRLVRRPELEQAKTRFERYAESRVNAARAFASKALFRLVIPRNALLARRLPWT